MIVLGADTHKRSHTIAAVAAVTGELRGEQTVVVGRRGFGALLRWARGLDGERVWALEDCRHVSGGLERFLIERGERVLRIPTRLTAKARSSARQRGKSDPIDALNVARAALQEGLESFPAAHLDGPELDLRLLVDHRERLVRHRVELNSTLLWHLHDLWPELRLPGGALFSKKWSTRIARRLARAEQTMRVRIARDELRRLRELTLAISRLEREITELVQQLAPQLLAEPGFGPLIAAKLVGEIAGAQRFRDAGEVGPRRRRRADPRQLRQHAAPPARPRRQPPDQRGPAPRDRHSRPLPPTDARLHRAPTQRRQEHPRSDPLPQALPRPPRLAPTPSRPTRSRTSPPLNFLT
jgi:transposase